MEKEKQLQHEPIIRLSEQYVCLSYSIENDYSPRIHSKKMDPISIAQLSGSSFFEYK